MLTSKSQRIGCSLIGGALRIRAGTKCFRPSVRFSSAMVFRHPRGDSTFDPESVATITNDSFLGHSVDAEDASLVLIRVPWGASTSESHTTDKAPQKVIDASGRLDVYNVDLSEYGLGDPWMFGICSPPVDPLVQSWCSQAQAAADADNISEVNKLSTQLHGWLDDTASSLLASGRRVAVLGGDHSVPLGLMRAVGRELGSFGILHIDAHHDLRPHRDDEFLHGHDKIMYNALQEVPSLCSLVQVGLRDFSRSEARVASNDGRVITYPDTALRRRKASGESWNAMAREIVGRLPAQVYLSIDVDGLQPSYFPATGTPVPGGLTFHEVCELMFEVLRSGRTIVGFDLVEVGDSKLDAINGAHLLYKLAGSLLQSNGARDGMSTSMPRPEGSHSGTVVGNSKALTFDNGSGYVVPYEVRTSPRGGMGVFSLFPIKKGELIWYPRCVQRFDKDAAFEFMANMPDRERRTEFAIYAFCFDGTINYIHDDNRYTNHSDDPTSGGQRVPEGTEGCFETYAVRDIAAGEELTESYSEWTMMDWVPALNEAFPSDSDVPFCCMELAKEDFDAQ